jgi:hypothetical protein
LPIHLDEPVELWRDKKPVKSNDVVLLRVTVPNPAEFMPMNIDEPLVVLDDWTCLELENPMATASLSSLRRGSRRARRSGCHGAG